MLGLEYDLSLGSYSRILGLVRNQLVGQSEATKAGRWENTYRRNTGSKEDEAAAMQYGNCCLCAVCFLQLTV